MPKFSLGAVRKNARMTQAEVAKALNVAVSTVRNWEKGITFPKQPMIEKMCELYDVPYDCIDFSTKS